MIARYIGRLNRRAVPVAIVVSLLVASAERLPAEDRDARGNAGSTRKVLIVTGEDYQGHYWKRTTPQLRSQLDKDARLAVETTDELIFLRTAKLRDYHSVVLHFKNYDAAVPGRAGYENLAKFVKAGGGLVVVHFACGAFQEHKGDFVRLAGRVWNPELRGHDPYGPFTVEVTAIDHPITKGIRDFQTKDELYTCLDGQTPITVLATARSKVDNKTYPMAFVLEYGKGRVFHTPLGHDVEALESSGMGELLRRGTAWTAGLDAIGQHKAPSGVRQD